MRRQSSFNTPTRNGHNNDCYIHFLRTSDVAWLLDTQNNTINCWTEAGILNAHHLDHDGERIFRREDIADLLARLGV